MSALPINSPTQLTTAQQRVYNALQQVPAMIRLQGMMDGALARNQAVLDGMRANGREPAGILFQRVAEDRAAVDASRRALREIWDRIQAAADSAIARGWITRQEAEASGLYGNPTERGLGLGQLAIIAIVLIVVVGIVFVIDQWRARSAATQTQQVQTAVMVQTAVNAAHQVVSSGPVTPSNPTGTIVTPIPGQTPTPVVFPNQQQPQTAMDKALAGLTDNIGLVIAGAAALLILPKLFQKGKSHG